MVKEYWANEMTCQDAPTPRHHESVAQHLNECMALGQPLTKAGKLPPEYQKRVYEYRTGNGYAVGACCITGAMPESMTSKPEFKEIPWPLTPLTK